MDFVTGVNACVIWNGLVRVASNAYTAQTTVVGMVCAIMETAFAILDTTALVATFTVGVCLEMAPQIATITVFAHTGNVSATQNGKEMLAKRAKSKLSQKAVLFATVLNAVDMVYANLANVSVRKVGTVRPVNRLCLRRCCCNKPQQKQRVL